MILNSKFLRYGKWMSYPRLAAKQTLSLFYPIFIRLVQMPEVVSIDDTLDVLHQDDKKSLVRFGDSEIMYITDKMNLPYQAYDQRLADSFIDMWKNETDDLLVGMPDAFGEGKDLKIAFWRSQIVWNYGRIKKYFNLDKPYYNATVTRIYYGSTYDKAKVKFAKWKEIFEGRDILLIEGEKTRFGIGNDLLAGAGRVRRILGPKHEAFAKADEILQFVREQSKPDLILTAMGPTAKYIVFNLHKEGYRGIDIGNLDVEYEWFLRKADDRILIPGKYTSEVKGGREIEDFPDESLWELYNSQIIKDFS